MSAKIATIPNAVVTANLFYTKHKRDYFTEMQMETISYFNRFTLMET